MPDPILLAAARESLGDRADVADVLPEDTLYLWAFAPLLYGTTWQSGMARELRMSSRTVRLWASGRAPVPERVLQRLARDLDHRIPAIERALGVLMGRLERKRA